MSKQYKKVEQDIEKLITNRLVKILTDMELDDTVKEQVLEKNQKFCAVKYRKQHKNNYRLSGYLLYCKEMRPVVKQTNPELKSKQIVAELGRSWKDEPKETQDEFRTRAKAL